MRSRFSRQLAVGPTSAISLMIATTSARWRPAMRSAMPRSPALQPSPSPARLISMALRLSVLVKLISDSILVGFKAGAGLTIAMTQFPSLFGVAGGGHNFFERVFNALLGSLARSPCVLAVGAVAIRCRVGRALVSREAGGARVVPIDLRWLRCSAFRAWRAVTGDIPAGLPSLQSALRLRDVKDRAAGGWLPAAGLYRGRLRRLAASPPSTVTRWIRARNSSASARPTRAALGQGYPVAGGLSQSAVNDKAGAQTPLALVFASITLAFCLLFLTGLLENLPRRYSPPWCSPRCWACSTFRASLHVAGEPDRLLRGGDRDNSTSCFSVSLQGILLAALISLVLLARASRPHVAFLGRIPGTHIYSDLDRHPENEPMGR